MNTETLINATITAVSKQAFVQELDAIGWRGNYQIDPAGYLMDYIRNSPASDRLEAEDFVRQDMFNILAMYDLDYDNGVIIDVVPR